MKTIALTREISDSIDRCELTHLDRLPIDLSRARAQHVAFENILRELGCDQLQGFLFAKPMTALALGLWATDDLGPRSIQFRASLFKDTRVTQAA